jgi:hypothetical protein
LIGKSQFKVECETNPQANEYRRSSPVDDRCRILRLADLPIINRRERWAKQTAVALLLGAPTLLSQGDMKKLPVANARVQY